MPCRSASATQRVAVCAHQLPGKLAPQGVDGKCRRTCAGLGGESAVPTSTARCTCGSVVRPAASDDRLDAEQVARLRAGEEVVERKHRVGLAAAEVGL